MVRKQTRSYPPLYLKESSRREFLATAAACAAAASLPANNTDARPSPATYQGKLCFFSKALPKMGWQALGNALKRLGFDGVDLTVRPEGHVLPERASEDLPKAVEAIRNEGLEVPMITTALVSADDPTARTILSTAGKLGIAYYKVGYYLYKLVDVRSELQEAGSDFRRLVDLGKQCVMQAGYHNHEGYIGAPVWDMASVIGPLDPKWVGFYFDPRHAVAEGGVGGWKIATNLVLPRLKMVAVKDFYWAKSATKGWQDLNCPLGEGMVDWKYFFQVIAHGGFQGPISLHIEYEISGATAAAKEDNTLTAAQHDLDFLKARVREAYSGA
jgi:sugar phosphate isomerase/epimerase